jgi:hypothetical protein
MTCRTPDGASWNSKISGCTISLQVAVHPGGISYQNPTLKNIIKINTTPKEVTLLFEGSIGLRIYSCKLQI